MTRSNRRRAALCLAMGGVGRAGEQAVQQGLDGGRIVPGQPDGQGRHPAARRLRQADGVLLRRHRQGPGRVRPALTGPPPFSQFRRVVAATQAVVLVIALLPVTPVALAQVALAISLALLTVSFGRDAAYLQRRA